MRIRFALFAGWSLVLAVGVCLTQSDIHAETIISTGSDWKTATSAAAGWNTDVAFDDSGWSNATVAGIVRPETIWNGSYSSGPANALFRKVFTLPASPTTGSLLAWFDDDGELFINGTQVINDASGNSENFFDIDVTSYLQPGTNLIAARAVDYMENKLFSASLTVSAVPEPSTYAMALAGVACGGFSMWRRRKRA